MNFEKGPKKVRGQKSEVRSQRAEGRSAGRIAQSAWRGLGRIKIKIKSKSKSKILGAVEADGKMSG